MLKNLRQRYLFYSRLRNLLEAGLSLDKAIDLLAGKAASSREGSILKRLSERIKQGQKLSEAIKEEGKFFPRFDSEVIAAGEAGNSLSHNLARLAENLENSYRLRLEMRPGNLYLIVVLIVGFIAMGNFKYMFIHSYYYWLSGTGFATSTFNWILYLSKSEYPAPVNFAMHFSTFVAWLLLISAFCYLVLKYIVPRTLDRMLVLFPRLNRKKIFSDGAAFARSMGIGIRNGISVPRCVALASETVGNRVLKASLADLEKPLSEGQELGDLLAGIRGLPPSMAKLVGLGEQRGALAEAFMEVAKEAERNYEMTGNFTMNFYATFLLVLIVLSIFLLFSAYFSHMFFPVFD